MCTYAAHHQGIAIAADRCREQMKLPVDQIDSCGHQNIGIVGYWATSILTIRTTVLLKKVIKTDLFPDFSGFWILSRICVKVTVRLLCIILDSYGVVFSR